MTGRGGGRLIGHAVKRTRGVLGGAPPTTVAFLWRNHGGAARSGPVGATGPARTGADVPGWDNPATDQEGTWTTR